MFLKTLTISSDTDVIREIHFHNGLNLIVDETYSEGNRTESGNNVGKTTVLKLIDYCFGASEKSVYIDAESKKEYQFVKDFLKNNAVLITLVLKADLNDEESREVRIERNFLSRNHIVRRVNGSQVTENEFQLALRTAIFPGLDIEKPTFRQIISHNFRYEDERINQTLRTLDRYSSDAEYETLHLFLFGCSVEHGNEKQELLLRIKHEKNFKERLEKRRSKRSYEATLALIEAEIQVLNRTKSKFDVNENFVADLSSLDNIKYSITKLSSSISNAEIRLNLIMEAQRELENDSSAIDAQELRLIYDRANLEISGIQKSFEDLVAYHNRMLEEKVRFVTRELPDLTRTLDERKRELQGLLSEERTLTSRLSKSNTYEALEKVVTELNERYQKKGEYQAIISQLNEIEETLEFLNARLALIDEQLFSDSFEEMLKLQRNRFNEIFAAISRELYGEAYLLNYEVVTNKKGQKLYKFTTFDADVPNISSGKKQGEISCFDIAYILFADEFGIPTLHFVLNDKKELMHSNQLVKIAELVERKGIQFVASILKDKLPQELDREELFVLKLSQNDKLFRIENRRSEREGL